MSYIIYVNRGRLEVYQIKVGVMINPMLQESEQESYHFAHIAALLDICEPARNSAKDRRIEI